MTNRTTRSKADLEAELKYLKRARFNDGIVSVFHSLIRYSALVCCFYFVYKSIDSLAGHATTADIVLSFFASARTSSILVFLVGIVGILYGLYQAKLRRDVTQRLTARLAHYERQLDPGRTSSGLSPRGDTRREDL